MDLVTLHIENDEFLLPEGHNLPLDRARSAGFGELDRPLFRLPIRDVARAQRTRHDGAAIGPGFDRSATGSKPLPEEGWARLGRCDRRTGGSGRLTDHACAR